jgi:hypothetical protein
MQDDMEAQAATEAKNERKAARKAAGDGGKNIITPLARMLVHGMWLQEWTAANPDADQAARKAAWKEARAARIEAGMKSARKLLNGMERQGVTFALSEKAAADADADTDSDDDSDA